MEAAQIKSSNRIGYAFLLLYLVIAFVLRNTQNFCDEGTNLDLASSLVKGRHLYRDLFENHFPFPVYLSSAIIFFAGKSLPLVRLAVLLMEAGMFFATMRVSRLTFAVGFTAAVWAFVSPYYFGNLLLYDNIATMGGLAMGAVCFAALARDLPPSRGMFMLLAVAGFIATMSNPFFALVTSIAIGSLLFAPRIPKLFVVKLGITIAAPVAAYFIYLAATGALRSFYSSVIVFNTTTYQKYAPLPIVPLIEKQLLLFNIFNPEWVRSFDPWRFNPVTFSPIFDQWAFSGLFYRVAAIAACLLFVFRRNYRAALFLYVFAAMLPLRGEQLFHASPFVVFCLFLLGILIEEALSLSTPWKVVALSLCAAPTLLLVLSGARYVAKHALQSDFSLLFTEADWIREAALNRKDVQLGHYPEGNYMYYLTGLPRLSRYGDFSPMVAEIGRSEVDADLERASNVVLVMDITGNVWGRPNYISLENEIAFANKHLTKEKFGWLTAYVSPSIAVNGKPGMEVDFNELGKPLSETETQITGDWTRDGYFQGVGGPGGPSVEGPVFGSFPDANTGTLRLGPFHLDGQTGMAIPLVTGPDNHNLSIVVRDAASKQILAKMEPPPIHAAWWAWRPELPMNRQLTVEVIAEDKGSGWGQWMAVGWPHILRQRKTGGAFKAGLYRDGEWRLASDIDNPQGPETRVYHFGGHFGGAPDDVPVTGDWDGSGKSKIGVYRPSTGEWRLDYNGNGVSDAGDKTCRFGGAPGDVPLTGDWDGSGKSKIGVYRPSTGEWLLDYNGDGSFNPAQDRKYKFGGADGDRPVVGDWTGSGVSNIGIVGKDYHWVLDSNGNGQLDDLDAAFYFGGIPGDILVTGDWNGNGRTKPGVFRRGYQWLFDVDGNYQFDEKDVAFSFGSPGDKPVTGVW